MSTQGVRPTAKKPSNGKAAAPPAGLQATELLQALQAVRDGDFSVRLAGDMVGLDGKIADTFNEIVAANARMAGELKRVGQTVGREGKERRRVKSGDLWG